MLIKWLGIAYLVWIGVRQIRASFQSRAGAASAGLTSLRGLWLRGFITSAANPKAIVFFAALFPQFLDAERNLSRRLRCSASRTSSSMDAFLHPTAKRQAAWAGSCTGTAEPGRTGLRGEG